MQRFLPPQLGRFAAALLAVVGFSISPALEAATLVNWGGNYLSTYQQFTVGAPIASSGKTTYNYSTTSQISPGGPKFYGALSVENASGTGNPGFLSGSVAADQRFGIYGNGASADSIRLGIVADASSGVVKMQGLIFFKKEDFLNVGSGDKVDFSSEGALSLTIGSFSGASNSQRARLAVYALKDGAWGWYLSETSSTSSNTLSITNAGAAKWASYGIGETTSPLNSPPTTYSVFGSAFEEIGAFGFYFTSSTTDVAANRATFFVNSFSVDATVAIPEPGVAVLSIGGVALLAFRRFRRN